MDKFFIIGFIIFVYSMIIGSQSMKIISNNMPINTISCGNGYYCADNILWKYGILNIVEVIGLDSKPVTCKEI